MGSFKSRPRPLPSPYHPGAFPQPTPSRPTSAHGVFLNFARLALPRFPSPRYAAPPHPRPLLPPIATFSQALSRFLPRPEALDGRLESGGVQRAASAFRASTALLAEDAPRITPKFVLLSSAAVTRPEWREEQRETFAEAYGIPIVGLNPGGILGFKLKGERVSGEAPEHEAGGRVCEVAGEMLRAALPSGREGRVWGLTFARLH